MSVLHYVIKRTSNYTLPIKSKVGCSRVVLDLCCFVSLYPVFCVAYNVLCHVPHAFCLCPVF